MEIPDQSLVKGLSTEDGRLTAYGPGLAEVVSLDAWRVGIREQQVAFDLARDLARRWIQERGDSIPPHTLFPSLLVYARRFLDEKVECKGKRGKVDVAANPYYGRAIESLYGAMTALVEEGRSAELPIIAKGAAGIRSTAYVDFYTGRELWPGSTGATSMRWWRIPNAGNKAPLSCWTLTRTF
jgi:type III restriction enzyme